MSGAISKIQFQPASDQSLLVQFGNEISLETHRQIVAFLKLLESEPIRGIVNLHPAYCSVLVRFDATRFSHVELQAALTPRFARLGEITLPPPRRREIPVCYGGEFGPDLAELAQLHGITEDEAIRLHSQAEYVVYFLGFVPGFAYLGGLPQQLSTPRLATPRRQVPAGSVAIGGDQTAVYPLATPGGWRLIGRTPLSLFNTHAKSGESTYLAIGDHVAFVPITSTKFAELALR